jgi:hypothetical protein
MHNEPLTSGKPVEEPKAEPPKTPEPEEKNPISIDKEGTVHKENAEEKEKAEVKS